MNLMLLAFLAIVLLCALLGYHRGLLKSALSAIGIVGAILLANLLNPYVRTFICEHTGVREEVRQRIELGLNADQLDVQGSVYGKEGYLENTDLPEIVKNYIRSSDSIRKGQDTLSEYVQDVVDYLTDMVVSGIAYITTVLLVALGLIIALALSDLVSVIPVVGGIDKTGGIVFGFAQSILIVWGLMLVITLFSAFSWGTDMMKMIDESKILTFVYKKNIFLKIVVDILDNI